jgi:hypothetical protein
VGIDLLRGDVFGAIWIDQCISLHPSIVRYGIFGLSILVRDTLTVLSGIVVPVAGVIRKGPSRRLPARL